METCYTKKTIYIYIYTHASKQAYTTPQVGGSFSDCPRPHGGGGGGGPLRLGRPPPPGPAYGPRPLGGGGPWRFGRQVKELGLGMHVGGVN